MKSPTVQRIMDQMEKDPWHVKLKRWYIVKLWTYMCLTRKYWDKSYEHFGFYNFRIFIILCIPGIIAGMILGIIAHMLVEILRQIV